MTAAPLSAWDGFSFADSCAYLVERRGRNDVRCGERTLLGSSYCPGHHKLCHLRRGSPEEKAEIRNIARWQLDMLEPLM